MFPVERLTRHVYEDFQSDIGTELEDRQIGHQPEIILFRVLEDKIKEFGGDCVIISETHGRTAQVNFRSQIRREVVTCEISDWLLVTVSRKRQSFRATFWQAKQQLTSGGEWPSQSRWPEKIIYLFNATVSQWELLSRRPRIQGRYRSFNPPENLLQAALSPSIGSYGVFYKTPGNTIEVNYSVAELLTPTRSVTSADREVRVAINGAMEGMLGYPSRDILVQMNLQGFLRALFSYRIGSVFRGRKGSELVFLLLKHWEERLRQRDRWLRDEREQIQYEIQQVQDLIDLYGGYCREICYNLREIIDEMRLDIALREALRDVQECLYECLYESDVMLHDSFEGGWLQGYIERRIRRPLFNDGMFSDDGDSDDGDSDSGDSDSGDSDSGDSDGGEEERRTVNDEDGGLRMMVLWID